MFEIIENCEYILIWVITSSGKITLDVSSVVYDEVENNKINTLLKIFEYIFNKKCF